MKATLALLAALFIFHAPAQARDFQYQYDMVNLGEPPTEIMIGAQKDEHLSKHCQYDAANDQSHCSGKIVGFELMPHGSLLIVGGAKMRDVTSFKVNQVCSKKLVKPVLFPTEFERGAGDGSFFANPFVDYDINPCKLNNGLFP